MPAETADQLLHEAAELRAAQRFGHAFDLYQAILEGFGPSAVLFTERAITAYYRGDLLRAVADAKAALEHDPRSTRALLYLALATERQGDLEEARSAYDKLLTIDPGYGIAYNNRGSLYQHHRSIDKAFADFEHALRLDPADYKAHYNRANLLYELKRHDEALAAYGDAIAANPVYVMAYGNRGATYLELQRYPEAIDDFTAAIHCEPRAVLPLVNRGVAHWKTGKRAEGSADLLRAIDLALINPWPVSTLASLLDQDGRWPEALRYYDKAATLGDRASAQRAQALRSQLGGELPPEEGREVAELLSINSGNQWVDTIVFWLDRLEKAPGEAGDALWRGLPFPALLAELRASAAGRDAHDLSARGDTAFSTARTAYRAGRKRDAILALYRAVAYFALAANLEDLATALGNLGTALADIRHLDAAARIEHHALQLKRLLRVPVVNVSRSYSLLAQVEQTTGRYLEARDLYEDAAEIEKQAGMEGPAQRFQGAIARLDSMLALVNEFAWSELDPPGDDGWDTRVGTAANPDSATREAALRLHHAVEAARHAGQARDQMQARLALAELLRDRFGMFREAYRHFSAAALLAGALGDPRTEGGARLSQARVAAETGDFATSRELLSLALTKLDRPSRLRAECLTSLSMACFELESPDESRTYLEMAASDAASFPRDPETLAWFTSQGDLFQSNDLRHHALFLWLRGMMHTRSWGREQLELIERVARAHYDMGQWQEAINALKLGVVVAASVGDVPAQARCWIHLGLAALEIDDYPEAEHAKQEAEALPVKPGDDAAQSDLARLGLQLLAIEGSKLITGRDAQEIAESHRTRPEIGRDILRTKISRALAAPDTDPIEIADSYCSMAMLTERFGYTGAACRELFEGLRQLRRRKLWQRRADLLQVYAAILMRHRRARSAWRVLRAALVARRRFDPGRNVGPLLAAIGECLLDLGEGVAAKELIGELERAGDFDPEWGSGDGHLVLSQLHQRWRSADSAAALAEAAVARAAKQPDSERHTRASAWLAGIRVRQHRLEEAESLALRAVEIAVGKQLSEPPHERLAWRRDCALAAEALLTAWYERPGGETKNAPRALALVERIRLRSLLERFGRDFMPTPQSFPEELKKQERWLLTQERMNSDRLRLDPATRWRASLLDGGETLHEFWAGLPEPWQAYGQLRLGEPGDPQAIVKTAFGSTAARVIALYPTSFGTYRWVLRPDGSLCGWTRSTLTLSEAQSFSHRFLTAAAADASPPADATDFAAELLSPLSDGVPRDETLCVVPSGPLLQLPFSALPWENGYLVERHPVAVLPALSLLPYWSGRPLETEGARVLGDSLGNLPGARDEAAAVGRLLDVEPLVGPRVTRSNVVPALRGRSLLHVACHAFYAERDPAGSGFLLADHSVFSARDFTEGDLRVRVAVLSACESGILEVTAADELAGLAASLLSCGASTVISTLWRIPDRDTLQVMSRFYEEALRPGGDLARALACAQRGMIADAHSPFQWAAFQLCGWWLGGLQPSRIDALPH